MLQNYGWRNSRRSIVAFVMILTLSGIGGLIGDHNKLRAEELYIWKIPDAKLKTLLGQRDNKEKGLWEALKKSFKPDFSRLEEKPVSFCHAAVEEISVNVGFTSSLKKMEQTKSGTNEKKSIYKMLFTETLSFNPFPPYYARLTFFQYLKREYQQSYEPDFTYSFGVANYSPDSFSLEYSNFGGNRLFPNTSKGEEYTDFTTGTVTATYRYEVPKRLVEIFYPKKDTLVGGWISYSLTPRVSKDLRWKHMVGFGFSIPIYKKISFWIQGNWYPKSGQEVSGDPDFIYGFGYYDWFPGGFILSYSNYASNSYPWRADKGGRFSDGSITIAYNIRFNTLCDLLWGEKSKRRKPSQTRFPWGPPRLIWGF